MTDPDTERSGPTSPRERAVAQEERHPWPPSAAMVWTFIVVVFMLGGPFTWWAVSRG